MSITKHEDLIIYYHIKPLGCEYSGFGNHIKFVIFIKAARRSKWNFIQVISILCSLQYSHVMYIYMYLGRKGFWFWLHLWFRLGFRFWLTPLHLRGWFSSWWPCLSWWGWRACPFLEFRFLILSLTNEGFCFLTITRPTSYIMPEVGDFKTSVDWVYWWNFWPGTKLKR